jgi:hypothetical protein
VKVIEEQADFFGIFGEEFRNKNGGAVKVSNNLQ